jgi:putative spermidine/putrescine transport system substrate-binding protein
MTKTQLLAFLLLALFAWSCGTEEAPEQPTVRVETLPWDTIEAMAQGTEVQLMMWSGDPMINDYMQSYVIPTLKKRYDLDLKIASGQGNIIVQTLMAEMQAGKQQSELDMMWINGETFYQLRQIDGLYGPWTKAIPNSRYIDFSNHFIGMDFQQPVDGYECPWGNVQMALIYDSLQVETPPQTREALKAFVQEHPGRFTFDMHFTGLTFLKALLIDIAGGQDVLAGDFDEEKYERYSAQLWTYLKELQPYLWREGKTFPEAVAPMHQLFASGELWFTMSNNDCEVDNKILQGVFPVSARAYVPEMGTIQNTHYMGIASRAGNVAGAMVVANFLISPEAQWKKMDPTVWGDGTVLNVPNLPRFWYNRFSDLPNRMYAPNRSDIQDRALMELAPEYMIRLAEDFRKEML